MPCISREKFNHVGQSTAGIRNLTMLNQVQNLFLFLLILMETAVVVWFKINFLPHISGEQSIPVGYLYQVLFVLTCFISCVIVEAVVVWVYINLFNLYQQIELNPVGHSNLQL